MNRHFSNKDIQMGNRHMKKMFKIISHQGNSNQNHSKIPPYTSENGKNRQGKKQQILERMWRKGNPLTLLVGIQVSTATLENSMEVPPKNKNRTTLGPRILLSI